MVREETLQIVDSIPDVHSLVERAKGVLAPCAKEVKFAFLFGSYAGNEADIWSDVDVGIYFSEDAVDEKRNEIRFALMDALAPLESQIAFLDDEDMSPEVFIAATEGIALVMNDEDAYHDALLRHIHTLEEKRLLGLVP